MVAEVQSCDTVIIVPIHLKLTTLEAQKNEDPHAARRTPKNRPSARRTSQGEKAPHPTLRKSNDVRRFVHGHTSTHKMLPSIYHTTPFLLSSSPLHSSADTSRYRKFNKHKLRRSSSHVYSCPNPTVSSTAIVSLLLS